MCPICKTLLDTTVLEKGAKPRCKNCTDANGVGQIGIQVGWKNCPDAKKIAKKLSPEKQIEKLKEQINSTPGPIEEKEKPHIIPAEITDCGVEKCKTEFKMLYAPKKTDMKRKIRNLSDIENTLNDLAIDG